MAIDLLQSRFGGIILRGKHDPNGQACALEFWSQVKGVPWTDSPDELNMPDIRPINDGPWSSDQARTDALVPILNILERAWVRDKRAWGKRIVIALVRDIISELPDLPRHVREQCQRVDSIWATEAAARAAARAAWAAAWAAEATEATEAANTILQKACSIWKREALIILGETE